MFPRTFPQGIQALRTASGAIAILLLLSACGGNARLSQSTYASLHSVSVLSRGDLPDNDYFLLVTFSQEMAGGLGGIAGSAISYEATQNPRRALREKMVNEKIDPGILVAGEFEHQLQQSGLLRVTRGPADAQFRFSIVTAGLMNAGGFATRLDPEIRAKGQLVRRDGTEIWHDAVTIRGDDPDMAYEGHALDEYFTQPGLLRTAFQAAAHAAAAEMIQDLRDDLKKN
jgi:hypothetical protein